MPYIKLENISKDFGTTKVLKNVSLEIKKGEFISLVGESGSGKSTILRILAGLEQQTSGNIYIETKEISKKSPKERNLSMVFQSYALYPHLSAKENIATPLKNKLPIFYYLPFMKLFFSKIKEKFQNIDKQVQSTATKLHILDILHKKPKTLSGGQRQRVALGRAMIREPIAFLMDEPLSNLDAKLRVHMRNELVKLHRELKATFIYVTHDQVEAMSMSTQIAFLYNGNLLQVDTPLNMYNEPNNIKVAEFIGTPKINTIKAYYKNNTIYPFTCKDDMAKFDKQNLITLGIRPEYIELSQTKEIEVKVENIENMGSEFLLHVKSNFLENNLIIKTSQDIANKIKIDDTISIKFRQDKALYFDESGQRVLRDNFPPIDCKKDTNA